MSVDLNNYSFPDVAQEDFINKGLATRALASGVTEFTPQGHNNGLAYRFFVHNRKNPMKSEQYDMEITDPIEMVQIYRDRKHKPCHRIEELPKELLDLRKTRIDMGEGLYRYEFVKDEDGNYEVKGGIYAEAYKAWKKGLGAQGLSLERWGEITTGDVIALQSEGIYTVQQLASLPEDRVKGRFPGNLVKAFESAIHFCNAQNEKAKLKPFADDLIELRKELEALKAENQTLKAAKPARGRPKRKTAKRKARAVKPETEPPPIAA